MIHFTRAEDKEIRTGTFGERFISSCCPPHSLNNPCSICGYRSKSNGVISSCPDCFLWGGELYRFEYGVKPAFLIAKLPGTCTVAPSDPPGDTLYRAFYLLEKGFGVYDLFKNNCEDFAIYCKTGLYASTSVSVGSSGQATSFLAAKDTVTSLSLRLVTTSLPGMVVVGCGKYCVHRLSSDIGMRPNVPRVPVEELVSEAKH